MSIRPKPGVSCVYENAAQVLDVEIGCFSFGEVVLFRLRMPDDFEFVESPLVVAVPIEECEEA